MIDNFIMGLVFVLASGGLINELIEWRRKKRKEKRYADYKNTRQKMAKVIKAETGTEARRLQLEAEIGSLRREYNDCTDLSAKALLSEKLMALETEYETYYND